MEPKKQPPKLNRITEVLAEKERSQRWLARKLGISANAMNNICQQKAQPLERFFEIAEILGVPITELINVDYKPKKKPKEPGSIS
jgi:repressor LexA